MNKTVILQPNSRITRSKAAWISSEAPNQQNQKRVLRSNSKRLASDNDSSILNLKKRAVLEDVTNVCCRTSSRNSLNATKIPKKNKKTTKSDKLNSTKVETSKALGIEEVAVDSTQGEAKIELQLGDAVCSINSNANLGFHLSKESVVRGSGKHDSHFGTPSLYFSNNGIIDIDSDLKDPQLCSLYAPEIYCNLRVAELLKRPNSDSMETVQRDITRGMRGILIDWLVEVSEEYKLVPDTLYLTVYIIDVYLSENYIERQKLQLLGITSMLIASKYEEICAPRVEEFCFITDNTYTKEEVLKMETQVLNYLRFQLSSPTAKTFLRRFLRAAQASCKPLNVKLEFLANYLTELTLLDYDFLKILPSRVAASAVFLARWTLDQSLHPWDQTLQHYTNYKALDLKTTVFALRCLQLNTSGCPLNAVRAKYKQDKFKSVASLSSPELVETMFGS